MNKNLSPTHLLKFGMLIVSSAATTLVANEAVPEKSNQTVIAAIASIASVGGDAPVARDQQVFTPAGEVAPVERTQQVFAPGAEGAPLLAQTQEAFAPAGEVTPIARSQKVFASASEAAPVARFQPVSAPAFEGEIAPIAVECGCEHQPVGGPGQSSGTYKPSNDVGLELRFKTSRHRAVLSFHSVATGATGEENYRVEASSDMRSDATSWYTVWEGSAAQVETDGGISLTVNLKNACHFFRVVVSTAK